MIEENGLPSFQTCLWTGDLFSAWISLAFATPGLDTVWQSRHSVQHNLDDPAARRSVHYVFLEHFPTAVREALPATMPGWNEALDYFWLELCLLLPLGKRFQVSV
jgi:hypothetical protein